MTMREIGWRILSFIDIFILRTQVIFYKHVEFYAPPNIKRDQQWVMNFPLKLTRSAEGPSKIKIFDKVFSVEQQFDWFYDPYTRKSAPREFSRLLDTRDPNLVGDIKYIWEINRHQHLSALSCSRQADSHGEFIFSQLDDWIQKNPCLYGPNWASNLELGLRLISWCIIFAQFKDHFFSERKLLDRFLGSIYQHQHVAAKGYSLFSSANNHLIGEAAGVYVASTCFPLWAESAAWRTKAKAILEREILLQFTEEGFNREQATAYQIFTMELLLFCYYVAKNSGDTFSATFEQRLRAAGKALAFLSTRAGDLPWFGDSDDGKAFCCDAGARQLDQVLSMTSSIGGEHYEMFDPIHSSAVNELLGIQPRELGEATREEHFDNIVFPNIGLVSVADKSLGCRVLFDVGSHGYLNIAGHAHADALSIVLETANQYLLIDPGTYSYHSNSEWRDYFRGTSAHNTVRIDGVDQSKIGGRFLWTDIAQSKLESFENREEAVSVVGSHSGYMRLPDPVMHRRKIRYAKGSGVYKLVDTLECNAAHSIELFFHFHPNCNVTLDQNKKRASISSGTSRIVILTAHEHLIGTIAKGQENPKSGWYSRSFHRKQPTSTLCFKGSITGYTEVETTIIVK